MGDERSGLEQFKIVCKKVAMLRTEKVGTEWTSGKAKDWISWDNWRIRVHHWGEAPLKNPKSANKKKG